MIEAKGNPSFVGSMLAELDHAPRIILDLNPSQQTIELAKRLPQGLILGLIGPCSSPDLMGLEKDRSGQESIDNVHFVHGSLDDLPFEDGTFDAVILTKPLSDPFCSKELAKQVLSEIERVLAIEGQAFLNLVMKNEIAKAGGEIESGVDDATDTMLELFNKSNSKDSVRVERKELNLRIAFKRIK